MTRLDLAMAERGLAPSRTKAQELIKLGLVKCDNKLVLKPNYEVNDETKLTILTNDRLKYVSRAGLKLEKAIEAFNLSLKNLCVMDIGSSTGGFTDCALQNGASHVIAVDVGTNLMHPSLRTNPKIDLHEQTNFKTFASNYFKNIDLIVCDVSFISLKQIMQKIFAENIKTDMVCLIKPQFECGKVLAAKYKGVVLNKKVHIQIINDLVQFFNQLNFYLQGITISPIKGGDGNIEYLVLISNKVNSNVNFNVEKLVSSAFKSH